MSIKTVFPFLFLLVALSAKASFVLLPMDDTSQQNHLKAYGITFWALDKNYKASWLLNYRGGSFLLPDVPEIRKECQIRGVSFEVLSDGEANVILEEISSPSQNMETVILEKAPKVAVYTPKGRLNGGVVPTWFWQIEIAPLFPASFGASNVTTTSKRVTLSQGGSTVVAK